MAVILATRGAPQVSEIAVQTALPFAGTASREDGQTVLTALDSDIAKLAEDRNITLTNGGYIYFDGSSNTLTFSNQMLISLNSRIAGGAPLNIVIPADSWTFTANGRMVYCVLDRTLGTATITEDAAQLPAVVAANKEVFLLAKRADTSSGEKQVKFRTGDVVSEQYAINLGDKSANRRRNGFEDRLNSTTIGFNNTTKVFTLGVGVSGSFEVFIKGAKRVFSSAVTLDMSGFIVEGWWYIWLKEDGTLEASQTFPGITSKALVAYLYYDATAGTGEVYDERHGWEMSEDTHSYLHNTIGTRYAQGLTLGDSRLATGSPTSSNQARVFMTPGTGPHFFDEDNRYTVVNGTGSAIFEQNLGSNTSTLPAFMPVWWRNGATTWRKEAATEWPFATVTPAGTTAPQWNDLGTFVKTAMTNANDFVAYWVCASNNIDEPIFLLMGQRTDTSLTNAQTNNLPDAISWGTAPFREIKVLYRLIFQYNTGYTNSQHRAVLRDVVDYRNVSSVPNANFTSTAHSSLTGLDYLGSGHTGFQRGTYISASSSPVNTNDGIDTAALGRAFVVGDQWLNQAAQVTYICVDNTTNAAIWQEVGSGSGSGNQELETLKNQLIDAPYQLITPNLFSTDKDTKIDGASTSAYSSTTKTVEFTANAQTHISTDLVDHNEFQNKWPKTVDLTLFWKLANLDSAATYQISRNNGVDYQTISMSRIGTTDTFKGSLTFTEEVSSVNLTTPLTGINSTTTLNTTGVQAVAMSFTLSQAARIKEIVADFVKTGSPLGTVKLRIVKDAAGSPSLAATDVIAESTPVAISSLVNGNNTFAISAALAAGNYHFLAVPDDTYRASYVVGVTELSVRGTNGGTGRKAFNGTVWSAQSADWASTVKGFFLGLKVKVTCSNPVGANVDNEFRLVGYGIFYDQYVSGIATGVKAIDVAKFKAVANNYSSFNMTKFLPDADLLTVYHVEKGLSYRYGAFTLNGYSVVFPNNFFYNAGVEADVTLVFEQSKGSSFDNSDKNAALLAANHLGSSDGSIDRSVTDRGIILRDYAGVLQELKLGEIPGRISPATIPAGVVGQLVQDANATYAPITANTAGENLASIALTKGVWRLKAHVTIYQNNATATEHFQLSFSQTSSTINNAQAGQTYTIDPSSIINSGTFREWPVQLEMPELILATNATYYLVQSNNMVGSPQAKWYFTAIRIA